MVSKKFGSQTDGQVNQSGVMRCPPRGDPDPFWRENLFVSYSVDFHALNSSMAYADTIKFTVMRHLLRGSPRKKVKCAELGQVVGRALTDPNLSPFCIGQYSKLWANHIRPNQKALRKYLNFMVILL